MPLLPPGTPATPKPRLTDAGKIGIAFVGILIFIILFSYLMYTCASRCVVADMLMRYYRKGGTSCASSVSGKSGGDGKKEGSKKGGEDVGKGVGGGGAGAGAGGNGGKGGPEEGAAPAPGTPLMGGLFD